MEMIVWPASTKFRFNHRPSLSGSNQGQGVRQIKAWTLDGVECTAAFVSDSTKQRDRPQSRSCQRVDRVITRLCDHGPCRTAG